MFLHADSEAHADQPLLGAQVMLVLLCVGSYMGFVFCYDEKFLFHYVLCSKDKIPQVNFYVLPYGPCNTDGTLCVLSLSSGGLLDLSLVTRKPVFSVSDQLRLKPACSATETSLSLEILDLASIGTILSRQRTTKALIRLHGCTG